MGLGWHPIYEMENKKRFQTTNQIVTIVMFVMFSWSTQQLTFCTLDAST